MTGSSTKNDAPRCRTRLEPDAAAVLLHDRVGDRQAEAGALADFLRREERIEDLRLQIVGNARAVVVDFEDDRLAAPRRARCGRRAMPRPFADSIACSALMTRFSSTCCTWWPSANTCGRPGGERVDDGDVRDALLVRAQRQRFAHHLVDVDHRARRLPLAREGQQVADDARGALRLAEDRLEAAADRLVERRSFCDSRSAQLRIVASGLFSSCATPEIVWPSAAIFSACSSW